MDKNRLLKLPLPTDAQEAASKAYVDALAPGLHAATHEDGGADEIDVDGLAGLLADDQHILDAEAIAAAKTVKLDDFATPDDNADLNSSTSRHGLLKKLDNTATNFMNGKGNWSAPAGDIGEGHINILPVNYNSIGQGTWALSVQDTEYLNHYFYTTTQVQGDNVSYKVYLQAGTYTLRIVSLTYLDSGIVTFDINDTEIASFDLYSAGIVRNAVNSQADIVVAATGLYTLKLAIDTKNGSASAYGCRISSINLWRTA
ncbi:hypothetical protein ES703_22439 [subsurface metagenome]